MPDRSHRILRAWIRKHRFHFTPAQIIALSFLGIILTGAVLLTLPVSARSGQSSGFLPALFTATSATCVTGLVLFDTWTQWSGFGQAVILCLIEIGGLGFMSIASLGVFLLRRRIGLRQRLVMAQAFSLNEIQGVVRLQKWVLWGSIGIQAAGALILFLRFLPEQGISRAAAWGVFHAVSAFCNAGFDIFGSVAPGQSMIAYQSDAVVCITLMLLIVVGGLGFFVWEEIILYHSFRKFSVYTRLVLLTTLALLVVGAVCFCLLEWNNPATLGPMPAAEKILNACFQSVTVRTAGFASIDQGGLTEAGKAVTILLMMVGGASGSTAGGVKVVTLVVLLLFIRARATGKPAVCVFRRTIPDEQVLNAMTIVSIMVGLAAVGGAALCALCPVSLTDAVYETVSALATVGLTTGITGSLTVPAQIILILYMYFGRVGVLTISLGFLMGNKAEERFRYAHTNLLIG